MSFKEKDIIAVGYSQGSTPELRRTNQLTFFLFNCSNLTLAYNLGIEHERVKFKEPSLSYHGVNGRMRKNGKVMLFDKAKYEDLEDAIEGAEYLVIKKVPLLQAVKQSRK